MLRMNGFIQGRLGQRIKWVAPLWELQMGAKVRKVNKVETPA